MQGRGTTPGQIKLRQGHIEQDHKPVAYQDGSNVSQGQIKLEHMYAPSTVYRAGVQARNNCGTLGQSSSNTWHGHMTLGQIKQEQGHVEAEHHVRAHWAGLSDWATSS